VEAQVRCNLACELPANIVGLLPTDRPRIAAGDSLDQDGLADGNKIGRDIVIDHNDLAFLDNYTTQSKSISDKTGDDRRMYRYHQRLC
jgi:hypothetical protein